jgi:hypothetical protein
LSNIDLAKILPKITDKSWAIFKYGDLKPDLELPYWTIILYQYPGQIGHWCLLKCDDPMRDLGKKKGIPKRALCISLIPMAIQWINNGLS